MNIFIAGGTSGIGFALAQHYLAEGNRVGICGRNLEKIQDKTQKNLFLYELNVCNFAQLQTAVEDFSFQDKLDLFINCTGSYADDVSGSITFQESQEMLETNMLGTFNCFKVASENRIKNGGSIAVISSVSAILNYENSSLYTKTKRVIAQIADAYRRALFSQKISVTTIFPGYVNTQKLQDLNKGDLSKKMFLISEEEAVKTIVNTIHQKKKSVIFPLKMKYLMLCLSVLPSFILNKIMFKKAKWMKTE